MKVVRTKSSIIHRVANCTICSWEDADRFHASKRARRHTEKTGHITVVENGNFYEFMPADRSIQVDERQLSLLTSSINNDKGGHSM